MASVETPRFTLDHAGHRYGVETASSGLNTIARLFVDGQQVDEQKGMEKKITLEGSGLIAVAELNWLGHVTEILAVPSGTDPRKAATEGIDFAAPAGSSAARMEAMRREHPILYAARHAVIAVGQVLIGAIGIGALLWGLLPRLDLHVPAIPWPTIDWPAIPWPTINLHLPAIPWPTLDLPLPDIDLQVPDLSQLAWISELWEWVNWLVPIVIALFVAWNEIEKRRNREAKTARRRDGK